MKHAILLAVALLAATSAQADQFVARTALKGENYHLTDLQCPKDRTQTVAMHQRWGDGEKEWSLACYRVSSDGLVLFRWYRVANRNALEDSLPVSLFHAVD